MAGIGSEKSHSWWWESHITPENSKWLAENLEEVDQSVKAMLKLIDGDGDSFRKKEGMYIERKPELIAHIDGFYRMYRSLADHYDHLTGELRKHLPSVLQTQNPVLSRSSSGRDSPLVSPDQKLGLNKFGQQALGFDLSISSSDLSLKEDSDSSSLASDSESESFDSSINKHSNQYLNNDGKGLYRKITEQATVLSGMKEKVEMTKKGSKDDALEVQESEDYAALLRRITECEEELKDSNRKLRVSEEEVERLKGEFKKDEAVSVLVGDLQAQVLSAWTKNKLLEAELEMEKRRVLELQEEVAEFKTRVSDCNRQMGSLAEELEIAREKLIKFSVDEIQITKPVPCNGIFEGTHQLQGQLDLAQKDIATLEAKIDSERRQVLELQEKLVRYMTDESERDQEIKKLNAALSDAQKTFSLDKAKLQSEISVLSEQLALSEARVEESELRKKIFENEIRQYESKKKEIQCVHEAQQSGLWTEIERLKADVAERDGLVESLNKKLDILKLKYDMLEAEKDGANAKVHTLIADKSSQENQLQQLEENLRQMYIARAELITRCEHARQLVDKLSLKVRELEEDVDKQRVVISDRAEEKREAIRQLCFSLEYYRNGYQELRQVFIGHKRHAVLAS